jgi:ABC-type lipopolysaccharide export system ATPase subunit
VGLLAASQAGGLYGNFHKVPSYVDTGFPGGNHLVGHCSAGSVAPAKDSRLKMDLAAGYFLCSNDRTYRVSCPGKGGGMNAVSIKGLKKQYGAVCALDGLNLEVAEGSVFGFLGPNGAGKTTTIRILTGLARASAGHAWVAGVEVGKGDGQLSRRIGHLPEEPAFYTWMTPEEYLDHIGCIFGVPASARKARTKELLKLVGLADARKRRIGGFSRGMRQRLGLAQALVNHPEVIFLDEPVSAPPISWQTWSGCAIRSVLSTTARW